MTEDKQDSSGFSFGSFGSSDDDTEPDAEDEEESEGTEVDEVATLEQTLERREEQIEKLRAEIERLEQELDEAPEAEPEEKTALRETLEEVESERDTLQQQVEDLENEREELKRRLAKRENEMKEYRKRADKRQQQAKSDAVADLVKDLRKVRSTLVMALDQDEGTDIRDGVSSTLGDLDEMLERHGVTIIDPDAGDAVDPHAHEIVHKQPSEHPSGHVAEVFDAGYEYDDRVLQPARVVVSTGESTDDDTTAAVAEAPKSQTEE